MFSHLSKIESSFQGPSLEVSVYRQWVRKLKSETRSAFFRPEIYEPRFEEVASKAQWIWGGGRFDQVIWIGIGGSALGAQWAFSLVGREERVFVLDNLDSWLVQKALRWVRDWKRTHVVVVSKSGNTLETLRLAEEIFPYAAHGLSHWQENWTVITESESNRLGAWAKQEGVTMLLTPTEVGGRFSWFSPMGALAYLGGEAPGHGQLLDLLRNTQKKLLETPYPFLTESLLAIEQGVEGIYLMVYSSRYRDLGSWMMQLWNESLGKSSSPVPFLSAGVGSIDQHSDLQFLMESPRKMWTILLDVDEKEDISRGSSSQMVNARSLFQAPATSGMSLTQLRKKQAWSSFKAMQEAGRMVTYVELALLRGLMDWWELAFCWMSWVVMLGYRFEINPYDQPGVEGGKKIMKELGLGY
jgi:glucose-6-phosphate isomerase